MAKGKKTGGRVKGTPNHATRQMRSVRDAVKVAFDELGGAEGLAAWGRANRTEFYKLAARLIPVEIGGSKDQPLEVITRAE
jgi:hypothetical protein